MTDDYMTRCRIAGICRSRLESAALAMFFAAGDIDGMNGVPLGERSLKALDEIEEACRALRDHHARASQNKEAA